MNVIAGSYKGYWIGRWFVRSSSPLRRCDAATLRRGDVQHCQRGNQPTNQRIAAQLSWGREVDSDLHSTIRCCCCCRMYVCMACMEMPRRAWKAETCGVKHDARLCYVDGGVVARTIDSNRRGDVATMTGSSSCARTATRAWIHDRCKTLGMWASETSVLCLYLWGNNKNCLGRPGGLSGIFYRGLLDILCVRGATC